jgi:NitT/TauT family transport system substrate-binding protein
MIACLSRRSLFAGLAAAMVCLSAGAGFAAEKIVFAWSPSPQTPQLDIALAKKTFQAAGLDVQVVSFPTGREAFEALIGGQADIASMAELPAVTGALQKQPFAIIGDLARYNGSRIITTAKSNITKPADLAGKRVGVTLGTNTDFLLNAVLAQASVSAEIVNVAPGDLIAALVRGDVDAIVPFPNFYPAAAKTLGNDYREILTPSYQAHFVLAANDRVLKDRQKAIESFLSALVEAEKALKADQDAAAQVVAGNLNGNISKEALQAMWKDTDVSLTLPANLVDLLVAEGKWIAAKGIIKAASPTAASMSAYLADAPLRSIDPGRVTIAK